MRKVELNWLSYIWPKIFLFGLATCLDLYYNSYVVFLIIDAVTPCYDVTCDFVSMVGFFLLIIIWSNEIVTLDIDWEKKSYYII